MLLTTPMQNRNKSQELLVNWNSREARYDFDYSKMRILIVDDSLFDRDLISNMLITLGCDPERITIVHDGQQAVEWFRQHPCDLAFMDCQMPIMDGHQATRTIRVFERQHNRKATPIIAFSSDAAPADRFRALASGMDDFLAKPFRKAGVSQMVEKWLITSH
ncbi:MAG: response regulator [Magnetococcales bacterium]|nr:response regulator [Magnetococcales bacterium]